MARAGCRDRLTRGPATGRRRIASLIARVVVAAVVLAVCSAALPGVASAARHWSYQHIESVLGLKPEFIMNTRSQIEVYVKAGDQVLVNPTRTVGIKVAFQPSRCVRQFRRGLAKLR